MRHEISEIQLTVDVHPDWPVLSLADVGAAGIYQPVAGTSGIVFVRYGAGEAVDTFVRQLGGMWTTVAVVQDEAVTLAGKDGRRVTVRMTTRPREMYRNDPDAGVSHETLPQTRTLLSVIGISHRGIQILLGYRLPEDQLRKFKTVLERIVNSAAFSES